MADHPNATALRKAWLALVDGDPTPLYELTAPDATLHMCPGQNWLSGSHEGRDTAFGDLTHYGQATQYFIWPTIPEKKKNDEKVVDSYLFGDASGFLRII